MNALVQARVTAAGAALIAVLVAAPSHADEVKKPSRSASSQDAKARGATSGSEEPVLDDAEVERLREAVAELEAAEDAQSITRVLARLKRGKSAEKRVVLHESLRSRSSRIRSLALRVLGEDGDAEKDLEPVAALLKDPIDGVRLAALMALRKFGPDAVARVRAYLPGETNHNNRKMAVKSLKYAKESDAVPFLVDMLEREKHERVRPFIVDALEALSGRRLGDDVAAWKRHTTGAALLELRKESRGDSAAGASTAAARDKEPK